VCTFKCSRYTYIVIINILTSSMNTCVKCPLFRPSVYIVPELVHVHTSIRRRDVFSISSPSTQYALMHSGIGCGGYIEQIRCNATVKQFNLVGSLFGIFLNFTNWPALNLEGFKFSVNFKHQKHYSVV
jgi:hypothetical protein